MDKKSYLHGRTSGPWLGSALLRPNRAAAVIVLGCMPWSFNPETFPFERFTLEKLEELLVRSSARLRDPKLTGLENAEQLKWQSCLEAEIGKRKAKRPTTAR